MTESIVSVLIPSYNHEKYIIHALNSVKDNSYKLIELIIIDDGSIDNSIDIIEQFIDASRERFVNVIFYRQKNMGVTKTLNRMIKSSSGEYITILASDDMLTVDSIDKRIAYLNEHSDIDAVFGIADVINSFNDIVKRNAGKSLYRANRELLLSKYIYKELTLRWSLVGPVMMYRRSVFDRIGYYDESLRVEDREFFLRFSGVLRMAYIDDIVAYYRIHGSNVSRTKNTKERAWLIKEIADCHVKYSESVKEFDEYLYLKSFKLDMLLISRGNYGILQIYKGIRISLIEIYLFVICVFKRF